MLHNYSPSKPAEKSQKWKLQWIIFQIQSCLRNTAIGAQHEQPAASWQLCMTLRTLEAAHDSRVGMKFLAWLLGPTEPSLGCSQRKWRFHKQIHTSSSLFFSWCLFFRKCSKLVVSNLERPRRKKQKLLILMNLNIQIGSVTFQLWELSKLI